MHLFVHDIIKGLTRVYILWLRRPLDNSDLEVPIPLTPYVPDPCRQLEVDKLRYVFGWVVWACVKYCKADSEAYRLLWALVLKVVREETPALNVTRSYVVLHDSVVTDYFYALEGACSAMLEQVRAGARALLHKAPQRVKQAIHACDALRVRWQMVCATCLPASTIRKSPAVKEETVTQCHAAVIDKYLRSRVKTWRTKEGWCVNSEGSFRASIRGKPFSS